MTLRVNMIGRIAALTMIWAAALASTGCGSTAPTRFYSLQADPEFAVAGDAAVEGAIVVGPFRVAEYLDRPQIVSRPAGTELDYAEFDRWAAPLPALIQRVVAANIAAGFESRRVLEFPTAQPIATGYQVTGRIIRFDTDSAGRATLIAQWGVQDANGATARKTRRVEYRLPGNGTRYAQRVQTQSDVIAAFSRDIVNALVELSGNK